jgi:AbrB family looped-hinge helix DNA binding protein
MTFVFKRGILRYSMEQQSVKTKITEGGRIVIPAKMREAMGLKVGTNVTLTVRDGSLRITTRDEAFRRIDEMMKDHIKPGRSVVDELIKERRNEAAKD